ncbi:MAG: hypothetical protein U1E10_10425 [Bdellovibrionales bacterium]|nr:hypothetical protein [Bdellovibrionales bacterium]
MFACVLLFAVDGYGEESRPAKSGKPGRTEVKAQMRKAEFFGRLRIELRKQLCQEGGLTDCFNVSRQSCEQFVTDRFEACTKKTNVAGNFSGNGSGNGSGMVSLVGEDIVIAESASKCISENFGRKFKSKLKESEECRTLQ